MYGAVGTAYVNLLAHWTSIFTNGNTVAVQSGAGRLGTSCLRFSNYNNTTYLSKTLDQQATLGVAFAVKPGSTPLPGTSVGLLSLADNGTTQVELRLLHNMTVQFTRSGTAIGAASVPALQQNAWNHLEVKITIHPSAGSVECRLNGVAVIGPTGSLNTRNSSNSWADQVRVGNISLTNIDEADWDWDDIIVWDSQSTDANGFTDVSDFVGDCNLIWVLPTGAGASTQFTPDSGSNYARVQDTTVDDNTSYVESSTINHLDTYTMGNVAANVTTVKSVAVIPYARKTDAGSRGMKSAIRSAGVNTLHATEVSLSDSFKYWWQNYGQDPNGGSPTNWTPSGVDAIEVGQKVTS